jgi:hypothetical protein
MNDAVNTPRRGRPRKSLFAPKPVTEEVAVETVAEAPVRPVRPTSKDESPRDRAARRAAEVRSHNNGDMDDGTDEFYIDKSSIPDGWSYEWKTHAVTGMDMTAYQTNLRRKGWEPVEASRHPELMPRGEIGSEITRKGMILMERPKELTDEAKEIEKRRARQQVTNKQEQLNAAKPGEFERANKDSSLVKVKRGYEPMPISD